MQRPYRWAVLFVGLIVSAVAATLLASGIVPFERSYRLVNVGGATNRCQCTQRLER